MVMPSVETRGMKNGKHSVCVTTRTKPFRPSFAQQLVRALLYTLQFALGYWILLLATYYNGYVIISIIGGAFIGSFLFQWEEIGPL